MDAEGDGGVFKGGGKTSEENSAEPSGKTNFMAPSEDYFRLRGKIRVEEPPVKTNRSPTRKLTAKENACPKRCGEEKKGRGGRQRARGDKER